MGATMPSINTALMGEIPIPDLPTHQQSFIAAVMTPIDRKIAINVQLNGYLEELANVVFAGWLAKHANGKKIASLVSDGDHLSLGGLCSKVAEVRTVPLATI